MLEILTVMCMVTVNLSATETDVIVTQGTAMNTDNDYWTVNFYESLNEGGYDMSINSSTKSVNSNDCTIVKSRKVKL